MVLSVKITGISTSIIFFHIFIIAIPDCRATRPGPWWVRRWAGTRSWGCAPCWRCPRSAPCPTCPRRRCRTGWGSTWQRLLDTSAKNTNKYNAKIVWLEILTLIWSFSYGNPGDCYYFLSASIIYNCQLFINWDAMDTGQLNDMYNGGCPAVSGQ